MKPAIILSYALVAGAASATLRAAELEIDWQDPEDYRDIRAGSSMGQERYSEQVMGELSEEFEDGAKRLLPADYVLEVTVDDVDLAGEIEYFIGPYNQDLRVVRDLYYPRMDLRYELRDPQGEVVAQGEETLKDTNFYVFQEYVRDEPLFYEKEMIRDWFYDTFYQQLTSR